MAKRPRKSRGKYTSRFLAAIKRIRSALASLKRKKVIPKSTEVKRALPTPALRRLVSKHKAIVSGAASTYKLPVGLPPEMVRNLKSLGYKTTGKGANRRVIVPTSQYIRGGKLYERPTRSRKGYRIERTGIDLDQLETQVRNSFRGLKRGDLSGFEVGAPGGEGGKSFNLYNSPEAMLAELMAYQERGFKFTNISVFRVTQAKQPQYKSLATRLARESPATRNRRNARRRNQYNREKGLRTSRGH